MSEAKQHSKGRSPGRAYCGRSAAPSVIARTRDAVTCADCLAAERADGLRRPNR